ncbi:MAG: hypothetical protein II863_19365 [Kiritimatiellae bacterium]|nr:hypothetical protein [Kiritimatiellia bacterium]
MKKLLKLRAVVSPTPAIIAAAYDENGKADAEKMKPVCFDTCQHVYRLMDASVAPAFSCGKELM